METKFITVIIENESRPELPEIFYDTRRAITVFATASHLTLF